MPNGENKQVLADQFADFSLNKIMKIRCSLKDKPMYYQSFNGVKLETFRLVS